METDPAAMSTTKTSEILPEKESPSAEGPSATFIAAISEFINPESEGSSKAEDQNAFHHEGGHAVSTLGRRRNRPKVENYVAARIRERRTELKMKQSALAEKMGVSASLVSQWEQAKTRVLADDLERLAEALGTSRAYLVGGPSGVWQYATTRITDKQQEDDELVSVAEHHDVPGGEKRYIFAKRAVPLTELRDMQEQLIIDGFRELSDVQRVLVIKLIQELAGHE